MTAYALHLSQCYSGSHGQNRIVRSTVTVAGDQMLVFRVVHVVYESVKRPITAVCPEKESTAYTHKKNLFCVCYLSPCDKDVQRHFFGSIIVTLILLLDKAQHGCPMVEFLQI